eukprot:Trichotokara_eunicae@DN6520_c0_g1_i1.p1
MAKFKPSCRTIIVKGTSASNIAAASTYVEREGVVTPICPLPVVNGGISVAQVASLTGPYSEGWHADQVRRVSGGNPNVKVAIGRFDYECHDDAACDFGRVAVEGAGTGKKVLAMCGC